MKITKGRLKEIIKEELELEEYGFPMAETPVEVAREGIETILSDLWDETENNDVLRGLLTSLLDSLEKGFIGEPT
jgi:hypothetical protein